MQDEHNEGDDENEVDEATGDVKSKSTTPKEQQDDGDNE